MDSKTSGIRLAPIELQDYEDGTEIKEIADGTANDAADMFRLGKRQELKRNFRFYSIVAFVTIMQGTWESTLVANYFGLYDGGTAGVIWLTIIVWLCMIAVIACMAEMASMAPTAGGQYHWVSELAPRSLEKPLSYIVGWCCCLGWVSGIPACAQFIVELVQGMTLLKSPDANITTLWQSTLMIFLFLALIFAVNMFLSKYLPLIESVMLVVHVLGFLAILILLWVVTDHPPASQIFTQFYDGGGWGSYGLATFVGIGTPLWCFIGPDAGAHLAEEMKDSSLQLPRAMMWATFFNGVLGVPMLITFCFSISNIDEALDSASGVPILDIVYAATGSYAGTCIMGTLLLVLYFVGSCNVVAAATRQCWAFARDGGFPFSSWITRVRKDQPFNALWVCIAISFLLAAINFGSDVALNAIISVSNAELVFSYIVSISCIALKRIRGEQLLPRRWDMGWMGLPVNLFSLAFLWVSFVFSFFPLAPSVGDPAWAADMNWASLMFAAVTILAFGYYMAGGRNRYVPPVRLVKAE